MRTLRVEPKLLCAALSALSAALSGCADSTGVGNPVTGELSLAIVRDDEEPVVDAVDTGMAGSSTATLPAAALERAVLVLGRLRFIPCDESQASVEQSGPFVVDLLEGRMDPPLEAFAAPDGGICGFDAELAPARDSAELGARSVFFSGVRADGTPFLLFANMRATLRVRASSLAGWGTPETPAILWALRPRRWAAQMELSAVEPAVWAGGRRRSIVIDVNRHPALFALIRSRLASESAIFRDGDTIGALDASDRAEGELGTASLETAE